MSTIRRDVGQLLSLIANISGTGQDIENWKQIWSTAGFGGFGKKFGELWSTNKKLQVRMLTHHKSIMRSAYANASEFVTLLRGGRISTP